MAEVHRQRRFRSPRERVWAVLTSRDGLAAWLGPTDLIPEVGRPFALELDGPFGQLRVTGEVLEVDPPARLVLRWCHGSEDTRVVVQLDETSDGTRLVLRHRGFRGLLGALLALWLTVRYHRALARLSGASLLGPVLTGGAALAVALATLLLLIPRFGTTPPQPVARPPASSPAAAASHPATPTTPTTPTPGGATAPPPAPRPTPVRPTPPPEPAPALTDPDHDDLGELLASLSGGPGPDLSRSDAPAPAPRPAHDDEPRGRLALLAPHTPRRLSPLEPDDATNLWVRDLLFDRLYEVVDGTAFSRVVDADRAWPDRDGLTLELRSGLRWHDGRRVTPADVCFSLDTFVDPHNASPHADRWRERVAGCEVHGRSVDIALHRPWSDPRLALDLPLLPRHVLQAPDPYVRWRFSTHPIGTGPLRGTSGRRSTTMHAADGSRPTHIAEVQWTGDVDPRIAIRQLASGELDGIVGIAGEHLPELRATGAALYPLTAKTRVVAMDAAEGPTADRDLRAALVAVLEGAGVTVPRATLRVGRHYSYPDDHAHALVNAWSAAGVRVELHPLNRDLDFDVALVTVDLLAHRHPLQALVGAGTGNPFGLEMPEVQDVLEAGGEENIGTWLRVADVLDSEAYTHIQASESTWLALGPRVHVGEVPPSRPFLHFDDWWLADP